MRERSRSALSGALVRATSEERRALITSLTVSRLDGRVILITGSTGIAGAAAEVLVNAARWSSSPRAPPITLTTSSRTSRYVMSDYRFPLIYLLGERS